MRRFRLSAAARLRGVALFAALTVAIVTLGARTSAKKGQAEASGPFIVAVAAGTTLLPVARFTGSAWVNTWPPPLDLSAPVPALADVPAAWLGQPVPRQWTLSTSDGRRSTLRVIGTTRDRGGCSTLVRLTLDEGRVPEGVALNTDRPVRPVPVLDSADSQWGILETAAVGAIRENQQRLVAERLRRYRESEDGRILREALSPLRLASVPITIDYIYRERDESIAYFEGHVVARADLYQLQGFTVTGWLVEDTARHWQGLSLAGDLVTSESNGLGSSQRVPLGSFRLGGKVLWVLAVHGYESTGYVIDEVMPSGIREIIAGGAEGC